MPETVTSDWVSTPFGALCQRIVNGGTPETDTPSYWSGDTPWITGADFTSRGLGEFRRYVTELGIRASATSVVKQGNLLVVTRTGVGKLAIAPCDVAISQDITGIYIDAQKADTEFVYYLLSRELDELKKLNQGTSINGIVRSDLERHSVWIPCSTAIQKKLAAVFSSIDIAIERTEALIAKHQRIKAGLMHDLFTRGVLPNGQLRPRRSEAPELYQTTTVGWIPSDWQLTGLQAMSRAGVSWIRTGPFGSALKGEHWRMHGHPVITIGALGEGEFRNQDLLFVDSKDAARLRDFQLSAGDVVFSRVADVGRSVVIREQHAGWIMSSNLMRIALDPELVRPDYLQMQLAGDSRIKAQIRAQVNSGGRDVANSAVLSRLRFAWPDPNEQDRIISRVLLTERALQAERRTAEKLQKQKLGLMQDLLTGRVSVEHLAPELASA
jgi:type I restriction enzyme S subunit